MSAMPLHLPTDKLHVPLDRLPLDKLPLERLPFVERKRSRRVSPTALLLGVPVLGLLVALVAYWRRTRAQADPHEYLEADVKQQVEDSLTRVGITPETPGRHRTA